MPNFTQHLCFLLPSSRSQSLKMVLDANESTRQTRDQESSMHHLSDESHKDDIDTQEVHSQDQCISSDSSESYKKFEEAQMKPLLFMGNPSFGTTHDQVEKNKPMGQAQHGYSDPRFNGFYTAYGPQSMPHIIQIARARVPLPLDLSEDGPIYVNAKQYHGILRRRQIRAKLEAQNKLVKNRRPYLHESRHKHALNRVRGSGGRFLPTKKGQQSKPTCFSTSGCEESQLSGNGPMRSCHVINRDMIFSQTDHGFSGNSWEMRGNEGFVSNGTHHDRGSIGR